MITFFSPDHSLHAPEYEFYRGQRVPCFETPSRAEYVRTQLLALDAGNAQLQPFPSVWPVRTLRSDREPDNFIAKLGLYSMDNGTPLVAGTWTAAKAGVDAAASAAQALASGARGVFCATRVLRSR